MKTITPRWRWIRNLKRHLLQLDGKAIELKFEFHKKRDRHFMLWRHRRMIVIGLFWFAIVVQIKPRKKNMLPAWVMLDSGGRIANENWTLDLKSKSCP